MRAMRPACLALTLSALALGGLAERADARTDVGFHLYASVSNYYRAPRREVIVIRERYLIPEEEIPVALYLADRTRVSVRVIIDLRQRGESWDGITRRFGLGPEVYYVPVPVRTYVPVQTGPPYGKAHGHYKHKHGKRWKHRGWRCDD